MDYKELVKQLKACTVTVIWPELAGNAAVAIQLLLEQVDEAKAQLNAAVECLNTVAEQFDRGACHDDYAESAIEKWRSLEEESHGY